MTTKKLTLLVLIGAAIIVLAAIAFTGSFGSGDNQTASEDKIDSTVLSHTIGNGDKVVIYFFWGEGCPYCETQKPFLEEMKNKYPELEVKSFEVWRDRGNVPLFEKMAAAYGIRASGVPATFIGDFEPIIGFAERMKPDIENKIKTCIEQGCVDPASKL